MKIVKILPSIKKKFQLFEVHYLVNLKECVIVEREKKICKIFKLDKEEFKMILMNSISAELYES